MSSSALQQLIPYFFCSPVHHPWLLHSQLAHLVHRESNAVRQVLEHQLQRILGGGEEGRDDFHNAELEQLQGDFNNRGIVKPTYIQAWMEEPPILYYMQLILMCIK